MQTVLIVAAVVLIGAVVIGVLVAPTRIRYTERIQVNAPRQAVFALIACQEDLMAWSSWPEATGVTCRVEGTDSAVGAKVVYLKDGRPKGDQEVVELVAGRRVVLKLSDPTPFGQQPVVTFEVSAAGADRTDVELSFTNQFRRPFNLLVAVLGIPGWVRSLHRKDLAGLKAFCERQPVAA